jgi:uncharacterized protein (TIGR02001 family)
MDAKKLPAPGLAALAGLLTLSGTAHAQLSSTWTLTSDYDFRGVSVSAGDPALQASIDYEFESGFALGAWASNIDYGPGYDGDVELDYYVSWSREISAGRAWSAGLTWYTYPGSDDPIEIEPYAEAYVAVTLGGFHGAQWYAPGYAGSAAGALYTEANYTWGLPREFMLSAHAGYSYGDYFESDDLGGGELADFALTLARAVGHFTLAAKITGTDASGARRVSSGPFTNDTRCVLSVATTFPWGE